MVLFAKTHLSQIVLLRMNCALKAFHFFFFLLFSLPSQTPCQDSGGDEADDEDQQVLQIKQ